MRQSDQDRDLAVMQRPQIVLLDEARWDYLQRRYRITPRELDVARLICRGRTNEEIAAKLHITVGTVKVHVRNIYRKTWVENKILMLLRFIEDSKALSNGLATSTLNPD